MFPALTTFQDQLKVQTSNYQGKRNFEGNQIAKILDNLDKLKDIIPEHLTDFYDTFVTIRDFKKAVCGTSLDPDFQYVIDKLEETKKNIIIPLVYMK